ncbi:hypothetical protein [Kitasatospora brasiliensis]|uniref:hypothetical protein n=1 Tax=Kitasatospora brasiliensis TaxID=3058040 RepID=UPI002930FC1B|nr:hypothetical protein [Kitasatospora sp. K002]
MRRSALLLVSAASMAPVLSLLGAPPAPAGAAPSARAGGAFTVSAQDCGPWGCQYAPPYFVLDDPTGCHAVPAAPATIGSRWTRWWNGTDRNAYLYVDGTCTGVADAVLDEKSAIEFGQAPYRSIRFS